MLVEEAEQEVASLGGELPAGVAQLVDHERKQPRLLLRLGRQQLVGCLDGFLLDKVDVVPAALVERVDEYGVAALDGVLHVPVEELPCPGLGVGREQPERLLGEELEGPVREQGTHKELPEGLDGLCHHVLATSRLGHVLEEAVESRNVGNSIFLRQRSSSGELSFNTESHTKACLSSLGSIRLPICLPDFFSLCPSVFMSVFVSVCLSSCLYMLLPPPPRPPFSLLLILPSSPQQKQQLSSDKLMQNPDLH